MRKFIVSLITAFALSFFLGDIVEASTGIDSVAIGIVYFAGAFVPKPANILADLNVEIWHKFIEEELFPDDSFMNYAVDVSGEVLNGKVVHIPNAGKASNVKRNRTNLPAQVKRREDVDVTYTLDEFTSDPIFISDIEKVELSYDKISSVMSGDMSNMRKEVSEWMIFKWFTNANFIPTTGDAVPSHVPNSTGNRKAFTIADIIAAQVIFNKADFEQSGRYMMLDATMYAQLQTEMSSNAQRDFLSHQDVAKGILGQLYGFNIMMRSTVAILNTSNVLQNPDYEPVTTSRAGAVAWQRTAVEKAKGTIKMFDDTNSPTMYGDIYSFLTRAGGRNRRADKAGVLVISQANA